MIPPILVYHKVAPGFELGVNVVVPAAFRRQMRWLAANGYRGIGLSESFAPRPVPPAPVAITFDDGYDCVREHALPVLRELGFRCTVFVPSDYVGRLNRWDTGLLGRRYRHLDENGLRELLAAGCEIGSHSATHRDLRRLGAEALHDEIAGSRERLEAAIGSSPRAFAYPFGRADRRVRQAVIDAGYALACGGVPGPSDGATDTFRLPRWGMRAVDGIGSLRRKLDGGRVARLERAKESLAHFASGGTAWTKVHLPFLP